MRKRAAHFTVPALLLASVFPCFSTPAQGQNFYFEQARWRLEVQGVGGAYSGKVNRDGDYYFTGCLEYECPAFQRSSFGLRLYPLLVYHEEEGDNAERATIYGTALGITHRIYQYPGSRDGIFGELGGSLLWQSREFEGNSARVNFMTEVGVGYLFPESHWYGALKWSHLSNSGTSGRNSAVNGLVVAIGYTF